jgi:hypothetical protein
MNTGRAASAGLAATQIFLLLPGAREAPDNTRDAPSLA